MLEFMPKIRLFLSSHLSDVRPCDVLLHGHEIADTSGFHHRWCYAAYKNAGGLYDFTRYYLGIDRKYHTFLRSHVDMMVKGGAQIHNEHEWVCWQLSVHFFDTVSVNTIFDMLFAMFMQRIAVAEWEVVDPILNRDDGNTTTEPTTILCDESECSPCSPRKTETRPRDEFYRQPNVQKWASAYNSKNAFR
jgi:hypothetical protein